MTSPSLLKMSALALFSVCPTLYPALGAAQDAEPAAEYIADSAVESITDREIGWDARLSLGASGSLTSNSNVVGKQEGSTFALSIALEGGLDYLYHRHELRNSLVVAETFTRTPAVSEFVKTADEVLLESIYYYLLTSWAGPFARLSIDTSLLPTYVVQGSDEDFLITRPDGTVEEFLDTDRLRLAGSLEPTTFKESVGAWIRPYEEPFLKVEFRAGVGGRQTLAEGVIAIDDDDQTGDIEGIYLLDVIQAGTEFAAELAGAVVEERVTYRLSAVALTPFLNNAEADDERSAVELTNVDLLGRISFKLVDWASIDYQLKAMRQPQLVEGWQVQNNLLLTISYALIESDVAE